MLVGVRWCLSLFVLSSLAACTGGGDDVVIIYASGGSGTQTGGSSGSVGSGGAAGSGGSLLGSGGAAGGQIGAGGVGGSGGTSGVSGSGGNVSTAGSAGTGGAPVVCSPWPQATSTEDTDHTIEVTGTYDGQLKRVRGTGPLGSAGQNEDQPPIFRLAPNSVLKNVIVGAPAADGIHCQGTCRLENVWWEDVGEDAATLDADAGSSDVMTIECAGARQAEDKVFQHNGSGTMVFRNIWVENFNKFYRSCGNCIPQHYPRHAQLFDVTLTTGNTIVGLNENYGDTAEFSNIDAESNMTVCLRYIGNDTGAEPYSVGEGPDATHCLYDSSDIH